MKIRIFLADDHAVLRDGLRSLLEADPDLTVVGEAANGRDAVREIEKLQPDVAVLDISMPEVNGIDATEIVRGRCPKTKVVVLSVASDAESIHRALQAGAAGYLMKSSAGREVAHAVRAVHFGKRYLSGQITDTVVKGFIGEPGEKSALASLSRRERQILQLLAEGRSAPQIGKLLSLSPRTVETYRSRMMDKLGIKDFRELVMYAVKQGMVNFE
jgi:DNA-binding NarL/FixJ family response regulator